LGNLSTPKTVQKLQKALHAKAKAEAGYRFYALYDKISREDILAHAFARAVGRCGGRHGHGWTMGACCVTMKRQKLPQNR
jgi:RNA-directed DNA polymerase